MDHGKAGASPEITEKCRWSPGGNLIEKSKLILNQVPLQKRSIDFLSNWELIDGIPEIVLLKYISSPEKINQGCK
jgi:hypothetical protein